MKQMRRLGPSPSLLLLMATVLPFVMSCERNESHPTQASATRPRADEGDAAVNEALAFANEQYEQRTKESVSQAHDVSTNAPTTRFSEWPLPNESVGAGRPLPLRVNFYQLNDAYPGYLLIRYDVEENVYRPTREPGWLADALSQAREQGSQMFPPVRYIAVTVVNRAEHTDQRAYASAHKVAAVFAARNVFDPRTDIAALVAKAALDRSPFLLDTNKVRPIDQQRWLVVERHQRTQSTDGN